MNALFLKTTVLAMTALIGGVLSTNAAGNSLSEMSAAEIISILPVGIGTGAEDIGSESGRRIVIPVTGEDLVSKAYGAISASNSKDQAIRDSEAVINMTPTEEDNYLWLDSNDGYRLDYNGMSPSVSAMIRLENDSIKDYGFFFLFPYSEGGKRCVTSDQCQFSTTMLQEFEDMGLNLGANPYTSDLFEVNGNYTDNYVAVRLIDDAEGERYILMLSVEPVAISTSDLVAAE